MLMLCKCRGGGGTGPTEDDDGISGGCMSSRARVSGASLVMTWTVNQRYGGRCSRLAEYFLA